MSDNQTSDSANRPMSYDPSEHCIRRFVTRTGRLSAAQARTIETLGPQCCVPSTKVPQTNTRLFPLLPYYLFIQQHPLSKGIMSNIRSLAALAGLTAVLLLQACGKTEEAKAPAAAPSAAASADAATATASATASTPALALADTLTAYHAAGPSQRRAVIPMALAKVKDEIDAKGKSDADLADELVPCMNSIDEQVTEAVRATQPILDLAAVCLTQLGYKK